MSQDDVVEVYAAANSVEGGAIVGLLTEEGIQARLVGDALGLAGGALPLGHVISPRIWAQKADEPRARELIANWLADRPEQGADDGSAGQHDEREADEADDAEADVDPEDAEFVGSSLDQHAGASHTDADEPAGTSPVSIFVSLVGIACLLAGIGLAVKNYLLLKDYSATAPLVIWGQAHLTPRERTHRSEETISANYQYRVGDTIHGGSYLTGEPREVRSTVRYNPASPAEHITSEVFPPGLALAVSIPLGLLCLYLGRQFR